MSTKYTLKYYNAENENEKCIDFHFYKECWDEDNVYLELNIQNLVEVQNGRVVVRIPSPVFMTIQKSNVDMDSEMIDFDKTQLLEWVTEQVESRSPDMSVWNDWDFMIYGDGSKEEQIENGMKYWSKEIDRQNENWLKLEKISAENRKHKL